MTSLVTRPPRAAHAKGSLGYEIFQNAYIVRDLEAGMAAFAKYGIADFTVLPMPEMPEGTVMRIALAWTAGHQIELIQASGPGVELHGTWLREGQDIALHHFGYFINSDEEWAELEARLAAEGRPYVSSGDAGICKFIYVDAPELGHYLEFVYPSESGRALFGSVAAN